MPGAPGSVVPQRASLPWQQEVVVVRHRQQKSGWVFILLADGEANVACILSRQGESF